MKITPFISRLSAVLCAASWSMAIVTSALAQGAESTADPVAWENVGGEIITTPGTRALTIPAGGQIHHRFTSEAVLIALVSRPTFGEVPSEWAMLDVGPASLTFVRDKDGGGMVLLADEPLSLPFDITLDETGRSEVPLDIKLYYDQSLRIAVLTIAEVEFEVAATSSAGEIVVAVSAGQSSAWNFDLLEVDDEVDRAGDAASMAGVDPDRGGKNTSGDEVKLVAASGNRAEIRRQAVADSRALFVQGEDAAAEKVLTNANRNPRNTAEWHLESANALVQMTYSLVRAGQAEKAAALAARALEHTELAARKASRGPGRSALTAAADETAAFIHERLLGDYTAARASYERAAMRHPLGDAERGIRRLQAIKMELRRKSASPLTKGGE